MEVVKIFNNELSSLYDVKPPISKAKMTAITKSAIKGIKYYKHIVQSVEKFIQKCRPEYKVPGLYVVDSIVRQSRHQFGPDKDVFGPRFVKNITSTFHHLFKCPEEDRSRIIRVLNLWQKNTVFPIEVIQPLMDMGHPNSTSEWPLDVPAETPKEIPTKIKEEPRDKSSPWKNWQQGNEEHVQENKTYAEMSTKNLEMFNKAEMSNSAKDEDASGSSLFKNQTNVAKGPEETVKFNKKLLDFDYGDEEDEEEAKNDDNSLSATPNALALSMAQNLLSNPELLRQLQQMTAGTIPSADLTIPSQPIKTEEMETNYSQDMQTSSQNSLIPPTTYPQPIVMSHSLQSDTDERVIPEPVPPPRDLDERSLASVMLPPVCLPVYPQTGMSPKPPLPDKDDRVLPNPPLPTQDLDERSLAALIPPIPMPPMSYSENANMMQFQFDKNGVPFQPPLPMMDFTGVMPPEMHPMQNNQGDNDERMMYSMPGEPPLPPQDFDERQIVMPTEERPHKERSRSRSRDRGRSGRRRSRSRSPRRKRSTSRNRSSRKNRSRSRERERIREKEKDREKDRERRRKGIPSLKKGCVSVCSTTLWVGHIPRTCTEADISDQFNQFGTISSINMYPPRGCAYVVMDRRQDANKALQKLKNMKLHGSTLKMAWAPGKGVKGKEFKDYWEVDLGVSYVPYDKIKEDSETLVLLEEGGFFDEESLPEKLKALRKQPDEAKPPFSMNSSGHEGAMPFSEMPPAPNMVPPPIMPPTSVGLPMVLPHLMQPQFGLHLPGMLPPQAMVMPGIPMGIPPPGPMLMVQQPSQGLLSNQPMPMVGGVPPMIPRTMPPVTTTLPNAKSIVEPTLPSSVVPPATTAGDATPTEEDGTIVSSPKTQISTTPSAVTAPSSQPMNQFNPMMAMHANRPMISVPPPVSTAGTPIPYPPPNVGFSFPPPGMRPPGQAHGMPPNAQFPWMQKQFNDGDSKQPASPIRPPHPHMLLNRPPFIDQSSPAKDSHKGKDNKQSSEAEQTEKRTSSGQHDKSQEMVISTDDESSMDIEYARNIPPDMPPGFPPDFLRSPMNMPHMRGPLGPMHPGPRFPPNMGSPFPMRMGGPRGMGGPGMHGRMDFPPHGPRGPMMPMGPRGPHRGDNMHLPPDGRDWYPRDFEAPPFERERDMHFRDNWGREEREPWMHNNEMDNRRGPRDQNDSRRDDRRDSRSQDDVRHDDRRDSQNQNRFDNSRFSRDGDKNNNPVSEPSKPKRTKKSNKSLMDDLFKLSKYTKDTVRPPKKNVIDELKEKPETKEKEPNKSQKIEDSTVNQLQNIQNSNPLQSSSKKEISLEQQKKDREARKRSRWGRTLSEEREFQIQKQNEIEMKRSEVELKFQNYEKSNTLNPVLAPNDNVSLNPSENLKLNSDESHENIDSQPLPNLVNNSEQSVVDALSAIEEPVNVANDISSQISVQQQNEPALNTQTEINFPVDTAISCAEMLPDATDSQVEETKIPVVEPIADVPSKEPEFISTFKAVEQVVESFNMVDKEPIKVIESEHNDTSEVLSIESSVAVESNSTLCGDTVSDLNDTEHQDSNEKMDIQSSAIQMES